MHLWCKNWNVRIPCKQNWMSVLSRQISSSEMATALRPFYFVVHPDLFGRHPEQRSVNEESLKHLSAHLEALQNSRVLPTSPKILPFYVRNAESEQRDKFKLVKVPLERSVDPKIVLKRILETCNLSTEYLNSIKPDPVHKQRASNFESQFHEAPTFYDDQQVWGDDLEEARIKQRIRNVKDDQNLNEWLSDNIKTAHERTEALQGMRDEVVKLQSQMMKRLELKDLQYDCGWNVEHHRGCLKSLERLVDLHEKDFQNLKGRTLVFAPISGVSLEGHVMLFTGDVHNNWLDFIRNISKQDAYLRKIPAYESALSQVLRQIRVARRKFMPKAQVVEYAAQLRKVTTSLLDYLSLTQYPKSWSSDLKEYEIVIESEAGPLMVSPTGQFIAPCTCPGSILVDFLTQHFDEATQKSTSYNTNKYIERELHARCLAELNLMSLKKDDSISPDEMITCLQRLLDGDFSVRNVDLTITHYYSVLSDGTVCVPWDWK